MNTNLISNIAAFGGFFIGIFNFIKGIKKDRQEAIEKKKANLDANLIKISSDNYKFKVFNKGKATAHNIKIEFPNGNILLLQDIDATFPIRVMEPGNSVQLIANISCDTPKKTEVILLWDDLMCRNNRKTTDVYIP